MNLSERLLTRRELHEFLREHGFPIGWSTLTKLAAPACGKGPPVAGYWPGQGRNERPLYRPAEALAWAQSLLKAKPTRPEEREPLVPKCSPGCVAARLPTPRPCRRPDGAIAETRGRPPKNHGTPGEAP
jgi:hypothetical protein